MTHSRPPKVSFIAPVGETEREKKKKTGGGRERERSFVSPIIAFTCTGLEVPTLTSGEGLAVALYEVVSAGAY